MSWDAIWLVDGVPDEGGSFVNENWEGGSTGSDWWVCATGDEGAIADGLYELVLSVEGEYMGSDAIFVGGDHPTSTLTIQNDSTSQICYVFFSPSEGQDFGFDRLGQDERIDAGGTKSFDVPATNYDLRLEDCRDRLVAEQAGLEIRGQTVYPVSGD